MRNELSDSSSTIFVYRALLACIEMLESDNLRLRKGIAKRGTLGLRLSNTMIN